MAVIDTEVVNQLQRGEREQRASHCYSTELDMKGLNPESDPYFLYKPLAMHAYAWHMAMAWHGMEPWPMACMHGKGSLIFPFANGKKFLNRVHFFTCKFSEICCALELC